MVETSDSNAESETDDRSDEETDEGLLDDVDDGAGCVEIWSHVSESRDEG